MKQTKLATIIFTIVIAVVCTVLTIGGVLVFILSQSDNRQANISNYEQCVAAGNPILESYPEQCVTPDGRSFTRELTLEEQENLRP